MRKHYDFSKGKRNPYAKRLKKQVTIRLDEATIDYFKKLSEQTEIPYQTLINLYLRDCAVQQKRLRLEWAPPKRTT
jgi:uncharacterized protein (DUF4415 family)